MVSSWLAQVGTTHLFASSSIVIASVLASKNFTLGFAVGLSWIMVASSAYSPKFILSRFCAIAGIITKFLILLKILNDTFLFTINMFGIIYGYL